MRAMPGVKDWSGQCSRGRTGGQCRREDLEVSAGVQTESLGLNGSALEGKTRSQPQEAERAYSVFQKGSVCPACPV